MTVDGYSGNKKSHPVTRLKLCKYNNYEACTLKNVTHLIALVYYITEKKVNKNLDVRLSGMTNRHAAFPLRIFQIVSSLLPLVKCKFHPSFPLLESNL